MECGAREQPQSLNSSAAPLRFAQDDSILGEWMEDNDKSNNNSVTQDQIRFPHPR